MARAGEIIDAVALEARVSGCGLHTGSPGAVRFTRIGEDSPAEIRAGAASSRVTDLRVVETTRSTTVLLPSPSPGVRLGTVEHVFAALAGLGLHRGVAVELLGPEPPLADGGARAYADAVLLLSPRLSASSLQVMRDAAIAVGKSRYEFARADGVHVEVSVDFNDARLATSAEWHGDAADFRTRIAIARTFGFEHEVRDLVDRGLASHATPESVVVIGKDSIICAGVPFSPDEPARHKLLDLLGDLYVYGGPPRGSVRAIWPGHAATHEAMRRALAEGICRFSR